MDQLDVYPFNLPPGGPFLQFFLVFAPVVLLLAFASRRLLARVLDRPASAPASVASVYAPGVGSVPYRAPPPDQRRPLTKGWIPLQDEYFAIAYLRGSKDALMDQLVTAAMNERLLHATPPQFDFFTVNADASPSSLIVRDLHTAFARSGGQLTPTQVRFVARTVATAHEARLRAELMQAGLLRSQGKKQLWWVWLLTAGAVVFGVGLVRVLLLASQGRPYTELLTAMVVALLATAVLTPWGAGSSVLAKEYLKWLDAVTHSLRADVRRGRRFGPSDVGLAVAVAGSGLLANSAAFAGADALFGARERAVGQATSGSGDHSSCGASSCSSSSCGGGGGCGGSCGGGGGCS